MECLDPRETFKYLRFGVRDNLYAVKKKLMSDLLTNPHVIISEFGIVEEKDNVWYAKGMLKMCTKHPCDTCGRHIFRNFEKNSVYEIMNKHEYFKRLKKPPIQQYRLRQHMLFRIKRFSEFNVNSKYIRIRFTEFKKNQELRNSRIQGFKDL